MDESRVRSERPAGASRRRLATAALLLALAVGLFGPAERTFAQVCQFRAGFAALRDAIGADKVGACLEDQQFDPVSGDARQRTVGGLFVWRKADNWTAFTDGATTWLMGPGGLVSRPNGERFPWERPAAAAPAAAPTAPPAAPAPAAPATPTPTATAAAGAPSVAGPPASAGPEPGASPDASGGGSGVWALFPDPGQLPAGFLLAEELSHPAHGDLGAIHVRRYERVSGPTVLQLALSRASSPQIASVSLSATSDFLQETGYTVRSCPGCLQGEERVVYGQDAGAGISWAYGFRVRATVAVVSLVEPSGTPPSTMADVLAGVAALIERKIAAAPD